MEFLPISSFAELLDGLQPNWKFLLFRLYSDSTRYTTESREHPATWGPRLVSLPRKERSYSGAWLLFGSASLGKEEKKNEEGEDEDLEGS